MIFLDESGDDGDFSLSSQKFFVISLFFADLKKAKEEYFKLSKRWSLKHFKWNSLKKKQKLDFIKYVKNIDYKVNCEYIKKDNFNNLDKVYFKMCLDMFSHINIRKDKVVYTGDHLGVMFNKVKNKVLKNNKRFYFNQAKGDELYGVSIADLWAGYINYAMKNNLEIPNGKNISIKEYIELQIEKRKEV